MSKLLMLSGLPASGKTTYARDLVANQNYTRVNKDDLRDMLHNGKWGKTNEKLVLSARDAIVAGCLSNNINVVVDDTNLHPKHQQRLADIAKTLHATFETKFFDISVKDAIKRDIQRERSVGEKVIRDMYNRYLKPEIEAYSNPDAPRAVIIDIDGTLANHHGIRGPYETSKYHLDTPNDIIVDLAKTNYYGGVHVIIVSGRDEAFREVTEAWLATHGVEFDEFYMRPEGDKRPDTEIKLEIFDNHLRDKYNVLYVIDDRKRVIRAWQSIGLKVLAFTQSIDDDF